MPTYPSGPSAVLTPKIEDTDSAGPVFVYCFWAFVAVFILCFFIYKKLWVAAYHKENGKLRHRMTVGDDAAAAEEPSGVVELNDITVSASMKEVATLAACDTTFLYCIPKFTLLLTLTPFLFSV